MNNGINHETVLSSTYTCCPMPKQHKAKLGSGARFAKVEAQARASGARDPVAVAAAAGIKKYGKKKMAAMSAVARKKKH